MKQDIEKGSPQPTYNHVMVFYEDSDLLELAGSFASAQKLEKNKEFLDYSGTRYQISKSFNSYWEIMKNNVPYFLIQTQDVLLSHGNQSNMSSSFIGITDQKTSPKAYSLRQAQGTVRFVFMLVPQENNDFKITFYQSQDPAHLYKTKVFAKKYINATRQSNEEKCNQFIVNLRKETTNVLSITDIVKATLNL